MKVATFLFFSIFVCQVFAVEVPAAEDAAETDAASDICDVSERIFSAQKEIHEEKKIGKASGAQNLTALNDAGRKLVRNQKEAKKLVSAYEKKYARKFDLTRCTFLDQVDSDDLSEMQKEAKPKK
ncbi:hypothetical protein [Bdellovibrio sp. KM01]|uniref:hypothetical protein n=1 Tax=Bdellovibrio sp. KM01 TaxID=2748865 RepID=UPI0015E9797A|nr:hypothetical protein [Bdellovibrio sp. KM01]QLY25697.1 hypothetical protein HW988_01190 [Bdellovibrio sp. KM01]